MSFIQGSQDSFQESFLQHVEPRGQTQVVRFGGKCLLHLSSCQPPNVFKTKQNSRHKKKYLQ